MSAALEVTNFVSEPSTLWSTKTALSPSREQSTLLGSIDRHSLQLSPLLGSIARRSLQMSLSTASSIEPSGKLRDATALTSTPVQVSVPPSGIGRPNYITNVVTPEAAATAESFKLLRQWECYVDSVLSDSFTARAMNVKNASELLDVEFDINEVHESDRDLVEPGAVFYWSIGYHDKLSGRTRVSDIKFRRLPAWAQSELDEAQKKGRALAAKLFRKHPVAAAAG